MASAGTPRRCLRNPVEAMRSSTGLVRRQQGRCRCLILQVAAHQISIAWLKCAGTAFASFASLCSTLQNCSTTIVLFSNVLWVAEQLSVVVLMSAHFTALFHLYSVPPYSRSCKVLSCIFHHLQIGPSFSGPQFLVPPFWDSRRFQYCEW